MKSFKLAVLYYASFIDTHVEGSDEPVRELSDSDRIREVALAAKPGDATLLLRSAEAFNGELEKIEGQAPDLVLLVGDSPSIERVGEAYKEAEIRVEGISYEEFLALPPKPETPAPVDSFEGDIDKLKARATELSVDFSPTIGYETLLKRVQAAEEKVAS